jgi:hypothetical protein
MKRGLNISLVSIAVLVLLSILAINIGRVSADGGGPWSADVSGSTPVVLPQAQGCPDPVGPAGALVVDDNGQVNNVNPDSPLSGGTQYLWTGTDHPESPSYARAFFKFVVPPHSGEAFDVWLGGYCNYTKGDAGTTAAYYFADNSWAKATLTWNSTWNQSFSSNKGPVLDSVHIPLSGDPYGGPQIKYYEWKVTDGAENIWKSGGTITLVLCAANETPSIYWRDFENKYYGCHNAAYLRAAPRTPPAPPAPPAPTVNPLIGTGPQSSSAGGGTLGTFSNTPPVTNPIIGTQSASLSAKSVTPGTPVTVTADINNKSTVNGSKKVTLYVNGQVEATQGVTINSGGSTKLTFNVSRSEPGDYAVYVDGVPAGSFKVELFRESDAILIVSAALVAIAFLIGMVMLWRRQRAA